MAVDLTDITVNPSLWASTSGDFVSDNPTGDVPGGSFPFTHDPPSGRIILDANNATEGSTWMGGGDSQWESNSALNTIASTEQVYSGTLSWRTEAVANTDSENRIGGKYPIHFPDVFVGSTIRLQIPIYLPSSFNGTTSQIVLKFLRLHIATSGGTHAGYIDYMIQEAIDRWYYLNEAVLGNNESMDGYTYQKDRWEILEIHTVLNDSTGAGNIKAFSGQTGSMIEFYNASHATMPSATHKIDQFLWFTYWNGAPTYPIGNEVCYAGPISFIIDQDELLTELSDTGDKVIGAVQV